MFPIFVFGHNLSQTAKQSDVCQCQCNPLWQLLLEHRIIEGLEVQEQSVLTVEFIKYAMGEHFCFSFFDIYLFLIIIGKLFFYCVDCPSKV